MLIPILTIMVGLVLLAISQRLVRKVLSLRRRLAAVEENVMHLQENVMHLQNAMGVKPVRSSPMTLEAETKEVLEFLVNQVAAIRTEMRLCSVKIEPVEREQTMGSFDYQWGNLTGGVHLPSDPEFMAQVKDQICEISDLPREWFEGKSVVDIGCGLGRFTYGLLSLGARVTAVDQSSNGLARVSELCAQFQDRLTTHQANILADEIPGTYDLVWSFGVVHHTGNTYQALLNVCKKVSPGGKVFLMIYGYPIKGSDFTEQNNYDRLRRKLRNMPFQEKVDYLKSQFDQSLVHGWFDAVSPRINDILTFEEIEDLLLQLGFKNVRRTKDNANLHLVAERR